jgi:diguanylate cyclase (GGDEF)-like protein
MRRRLGRAWRRQSLTRKFAVVILIAGIGIAAIPMSLSRGEVESQAQARAADKAALATNLVDEQRRALHSFATALAAQVAPAISAGEGTTLRQLLQRDSAAGASPDILGVAGAGPPILARAGTLLTDPALQSMVQRALADAAALIPDESGAPWIVVTERAGGDQVVVARMLDPGTVRTIGADVGSSHDPAELAIAGPAGWVSGSVAGAPVTPGEPLPESLSGLRQGGSAVISLSGRETGVAAGSLGGGFVAVVTTPVSQVTALLLPGLLLAAVILVAMLFIIVTVQVDLQRPLMRLDRAVAALGDGDFHVAIPTDGDDEIGRLGRSFAAMRHALHQTIRSSAARAAVAGELNAPQPLERALAGVADELRAATVADVALILVGGGEMADAFSVVNGADVDVGAALLLHGDGPMGTAFRRPEGGAVQLGATAGSVESDLGLRALCAAPLRIADHTLGVIAIASEAPFTAVQTDLLEATAEQVALALERYRFLALVQRQASIDDLTGLSNHRFLVDYLGQQVALAERMAAPLAILMLDIDHFKRLNDTRGHSAGDDALVAFAGALTASVRRADLAARYGGEEFVVVMSNTRRDEAGMVAEKIRAAVAAAVVGRGADGEDVHITVSIGVAAYPDDTTSAGELIALADRALYAAKHAGRNRVCTADESIIPGSPSKSTGLRGRRSSRDAFVPRHRPPQ